MSNVNVYIRWLVKKGWIFTVYEFEQKTGQGANTTQSTDSGPISDLVPGIDATLSDLTDANRKAIQAAVQARHPGATVEFGPVPVNRT